MSQQQPQPIFEYRCPVCDIPTYKEIGETTELEISIIYKSPDKQPYIREWFGCLRCLVGLEQCVRDYMQIQRVNRGKSLRAMRGQKGCGCG